MPSPYEESAIVVFLDALANLIEEIDHYSKPIVGLTTEAFLERLSCRIDVGVSTFGYGEDTGIQASHMWQLLRDAVQAHRDSRP